MNAQPKAATDTHIGMTWWNRLTERERREWMRRAGDTGIPADAWEAFKRGQPDREPEQHG